MCTRCIKDSSCEGWKEEGSGVGKNAHNGGWTLVNREKGERKIGYELAQLWCSSKKALARPLGSPRTEIAPYRSPMTGRNGPAPVPPPSQWLAESSPGRQRGLCVNAAGDVNLLFANLEQTWRLSTTRLLTAGSPSWGEVWQGTSWPPESHSRISYRHSFVSGLSIKFES